MYPTHDYLVAIATTDDWCGINSDVPQISGVVGPGNQKVDERNCGGGGSEGREWEISRMATAARCCCYCNAPRTVCAVYVVLLLSDGNVCILP